MKKQSYDPWKNVDFDDTNFKIYAEGWALISIITFIVVSIIFLAIKPAFAQTPDPLINDLQAAWNVKVYGDAQSLKAIDAILKQLTAITKERDDLKTEIEKLKSGK